MSLPGFPAKEHAEAVRRECFIREVAPLGLTENICGFEVRQMLFLDFLALRLVGSPFLVGGGPAVEATKETRDTLVPAVRQFLWRMSPDYTPQNGRARRRFMKRCRVFLAPMEPRLFRKWRLKRWSQKTVQSLELLGQALFAIRIFVADSLQDWGVTKGPSAGIPYVSNEVEIVGMIAREYGWSRKEILNMPMCVLLQHVKEIRIANGQKASFNPSDRIMFEWLRERNRN